MKKCSLKLEDTYTLENRHRAYNYKKCMEYILQEGKRIYGNHFILNRYHKAVLYQLLIYAIEDQESLEKTNLDLRKGILLMGESGVGKTAMLKLAKPFFYRKKQFDIVSCRVLSQEFSKRGFEALDSYLSTNSKPICLDNLGKELPAKHFGYNCEVGYNVIEHFYEQRFDVDYPKVHITTMSSPSEIEKRYGIGFRKMLQEMFNVIVCE